MIEVFINNEATQINESQSLSSLIEQQNIPIEGLAVAINDMVIPKSTWSGYLLNHQDHILLFRAIAGG